MFAEFEAKIREYWDEWTGEARAEVEKALADVKAEEAKVGPLVTQFRADLTALVAEAEPQVKASVTALADKLSADLGGVLNL